MSNKTARHTHKESIEINQKMASMGNKTNYLVIISLMLTVAALASAQSDTVSNWNKVRSFLAGSGNMLGQDPERMKRLRQMTDQATSIMQEYRQNGMGLPNLPDIPVVNSVTKLPDKLIRTEMSMLQDEIKMVQEMMENPISATMNIPSNVANMFQRMAQQMSQ